MNCIICNKTTDKLQCDECIEGFTNKKICSECSSHLPLTDFYIYKKNQKPYNKCKLCFNKKIKC